MKRKKHIEAHEPARCRPENFCWCTCPDCLHNIHRGYKPYQTDFSLVDGKLHDFLKSPLATLPNYCSDCGQLTTSPHLAGCPNVR